MASVRHLGLFPWCPYKNKADVAERLFFGDTNPIDTQLAIYESLEMPLSDAVAMYWRVKQWRMFGFIQATTDGITIDTINFDVTFNQNTIASEKNYVCRYFDGESWSGLPYTKPSFTGSVTGLSSPVIFTFDVSFFYSPFLLPSDYRFGFAHFLQWPSNNRPTLNSGLYVWNQASLFDDAGGTIVYSQLVTSGSGQQATVPVSFLGKTYNIQTSVTGIGLSSSFNIEASEYWPYDPNDGGGPIYDSTTGTQLRAFPTN
jgi:hypothetical protein